MCSPKAGKQAHNCSFSKVWISRTYKKPSHLREFFDWIFISVTRMFNTACVQLVDT